MRISAPEAASLTPMGPLLPQIQWAVPRRLADGEVHVDVVGLRIFPALRAVREVHQRLQQAFGHLLAAQLLHELQERRARVLQLGLRRLLMLSPVVEPEPQLGAFFLMQPATARTARGSPEVYLTHIYIYTFKSL